MWERGEKSPEEVDVDNCGIVDVQWGKIIVSVDEFQDCMAASTAAKK
jgi:hypothetical protein